jgi:hypothetical protein
MQFNVIFNDVPLPKDNYDWETVYVPIWRTFEVKSIGELYEKIADFIYKNKLDYSSYEVTLI